jgi:hypothetical protein
MHDPRDGVLHHLPLPVAVLLFAYAVGTNALYVYVFAQKKYREVWPCGWSARKDLFIWSKIIANSFISLLVTSAYVWPSTFGKATTVVCFVAAVVNMLEVVALGVAAYKPGRDAVAFWGSLPCFAFMMYDGWCYVVADLASEEAKGWYLSRLGCLVYTFILPGLLDLWLTSWEDRPAGDKLREFARSHWWGDMGFLLGFPLFINNLVGLPFGMHLWAPIRLVFLHTTVWCYTVHTKWAIDATPVGGKIVSSSSAGRKIREE